MDAFPNGKNATSPLDVPFEKLHSRDAEKSKTRREQLSSDLGENNSNPVMGRGCTPADRDTKAGKATLITGANVKGLTVSALEAAKKSNNSSFSSA